MLRVNDLMSDALEVVSPDAHLHDVLIKMNKAGYRHLSLNKFGAMPVVDEGKLVGMISYIDFLKHYAANR